MAGAARCWRGEGQGLALRDDDTIAAVSSGQPPAAIAVIRITGPGAMAAATALAGVLPPPRRASLRTLRDRAGEMLDQALVLVFPGPNSATGEDLVELHCHGGRAVVEAVERALRRDQGVRAAEPGEFTRRALANGRIDLNEAEGLADLLEAETEMQRRGALAAAEGRVSGAIRGWLAKLADLSARVEASIDYAEEGDVDAEAGLIADVVAEQRALAKEMAGVLATPPVERWRDGIRVAVAGPPNAGKSTLVNALAARDAAIVSPIAGTTRDRIEVSVRRRGVAYVLIDTAGLRETTGDPIERIGMARAHDAMGSADIVLWLGDRRDSRADLVIHPKADLPGRAIAPAGSLAVSESDPDSIERLWEAIAHVAVRPLAEGALAFHRRAWERCERCLQAIVDPANDGVLLAEQLRVARTMLADALGVNATEAMLDSLFARFCVGK